MLSCCATRVSLARVEIARPIQIDHGREERRVHDLHHQVLALHERRAKRRAARRADTQPRKIAYTT